MSGAKVVTADPAYDAGVTTAPTMTPAGRIRIDGITDSVVRGPAAYRGGSITTGGTSQQLLDVNPARRGFTIQNQSNADLYIRIAATATLTNASLRIPPGYLYETPAIHVSTNFVNIIGGTTGQIFYATEF